MKKGFTLAEVLITLAIIGVVAALTIPVVVHKYQQKQFYTQFMKTYNTIANAYQASVAMNGTPGVWTHSKERAGQKAIFEKYLGTYLKITAYCSDDATACGFKNDTKLKFLNLDDSDLLESVGASGGSLPYKAVIESDTAHAFLLQDGSVVQFEFPNEEKSDGTYWSFDSIDIIADTNGAKGPNVAGRDIFFFEVSYPTYTLKPVGSTEEGYMWYDPDDHMWYQEGGADPGENCLTDGQSLGRGCAARLLQEGKMSY